MLKAIKAKRGQSTVEYLILFATIIGVFIVFFRPTGVFSSTMNHVLTSSISGSSQVSITGTMNSEWGGGCFGGLCLNDGRNCAPSSTCTSADIIDDEDIVVVD